MDTRCEKHGTHLSFMGGRSAHHSNFYCAECDKEKEDANLIIVTQLKKDALKNTALAKLREAEKAMYEYFCDCEVGKEREWASQVYENVRTASRVAI